MKISFKALINTAILFIFIIVPSLLFAQGCSYEDCPGSVGSDVAAAFATEGYWLLADVVWQIENTAMGSWAPLLYILSYAAAGIMMAMGQPPRNYVWFFIGPAIYNWLVFTPALPVKGVGWRVGGNDGKQSVVWRKSEVGLLNTNKIVTPSKSSAPSQSIELPLLFIWLDELFSSTAQGASEWTGVFRKGENSGDTFTHVKPSDESPMGKGDSKDISWSILSHSKWPMLENITSSSVVNLDIRESLIHFLSSECGDMYFNNVSKADYINAVNAKGKNLPKSVFGEGKHEEIMKQLASKKVPVPFALRALLKDEGISKASAFREFIPDVAPPVDQVDQYKVETCGNYLFILVQAFRWEAGHAYNQIIRQASGEYEIPEEQINYDFLYGWAVAEGDDPNTGVKLSLDEQKDFMVNIILLHLIRNEFALAPGQINPRWTQAEKNINYAEAYQKSVGSKTKYGEMYTWTKLMPYSQGVLLYFLSAAYPFACMMMVIPGWHKTLFTWISFFAWAKSWDIGFSMVGQLEKSIWAMLANTDDASIVNGRIHDLTDIQKLEIMCNGGGGNRLGCPDPIIRSASPDTAENALKVLDYGMVLSGNLDMDLKNSYYIYLMSALYFAVPAVTGQLLLGAKAGASSMVNNMINGVSQEGGKGSMTGYQGDMATRVKTNAATAQQGAFAKSMRNNDFALGAFKNSNDGLAAGVRESSAQFKSGRIDARQATAADEFRGAEAAGNFQNAFQDYIADHVVRRGSKGLSGDTQAIIRALQGNQGGGGAAGGAGAIGGGAGGFDGNAAGFQQPQNNGANNNAILPPRDKSEAGEQQRRWGMSEAGYQMQRWNRMVGSAASLRNANDQGHVNSAYRIQQAQLASEGFGARMESGAYNTMSQRGTDLAQQQAGEDAWKFMRDYSAAAAGNATIGGLFAGGFAPDQKPTNAWGMAATGMLDKDGKREASSAFGYASSKSGGYWNAVQSASIMASSFNDDPKIRYQETSGISQTIQGGKMIYDNTAGLVSEIANPAEFKIGTSGLQERENKRNKGP